MPETVAMQSFSFLLTGLLAFQNSFEAAVELLQRPTIRRMPARVAKDVEGQLRRTAVKEPIPQVGTMISRPKHEKARGIGHCCQLVGWVWMSVERKYDGEYC
jgi:DNA ligase 4